jgi:alkanesulfonate monooxygenase SsuD/methylene tetrahydromethanopterin reductase-like flavin-dependent oxidoreductase (luciferase family)
MIDTISGGRLVAGMPLGTAMDATLCAGITPIEQRERYYEAHDLILKAWTAPDIFAWNGKYFQLPMVNVWPRPIQKPHPPVWVPGLGSLSTWEFAAQHNHCYCFLSYYGPVVGRGVMDGFWQFIANRGIEPNPYRAGFLQLVAVAETDAQAEKLYESHIRYFYSKSLHIPAEFFFPPGHQDYRSLENSIRKGLLKSQFEQLEAIPNYKFKDFVDKRLVIAGSPATVRDMLREAVQDLRVGNLMVLLQIGSMPHDLTLKNIDLFSREVMPHLHDTWDDKWENKWWPERLRGKRQVSLAAL